jgi:transposase
LQTAQAALQRWYITWRFLPKSTIEIDNNLVENAIRPTALGKKNWLFFGDADAGERSAVIYSIIESCRRHDVALHLSARHPQSLALTDQSSN